MSLDLKGFKTMNLKNKKQQTLPKLKLISIGGAGEVTRNLFVYEYEDEILIIDAGVGFPETNVFGIDYLLPDISYLVKNKAKIKGIVLTHGHEDHIGALPYLYDDIGRPPVYGSQLTIGFIKLKFKELKLNGRFQVVKPRQTFKIGRFKIETITVTHSIPDTYHLIIRTPVGVIYHGTDFKFDAYPVIGQPTDFKRIQEVAAKEPILLLLSDCLRIERAGRTPSEKDIQRRFMDEMKTTKGRFLLTTFSSNLARFQQVINTSLALGRYIVPVGRSIENAFQVAQELGYLSLPGYRLIDAKAAMTMPQNQLTYLIGGSQGQIDSSLRRVAENKHPYVQVEAGDKLIFSSDPIPGNEINVYNVIDLLMKRNVKVLYPEIMDEIYVSGHASRDELIDLVKMTKPKLLMPIGGQYRHMVTYAQVMKDVLGYRQNQIIIPDKGQFVEISSQGFKLDGKLKLKDVIVDGKGIGDVGTLVLEERRTLARAGMVVVSFPVKNNVIQEPSLASRGFVFRPYSSDLFNQAKDRLKTFVGVANPDEQFFKQVQRKMERFFYKQTKREPMIVVETIKC